MKVFVSKPDGTLESVVDNAQSVSVKRRLWKPDTLTMVTSTRGVPSTLEEGWLLTILDGLHGPAKRFTVEQIERVMDNESRIMDSWKITSRSVDGMGDDRIILPPTGESHDEQRSVAAETAMKHYVDAHFGASAPAARQVPDFVVEPDQARGTTVTAAGRFMLVGEMLEKIGKKVGVGFETVYDGDADVSRFDTVHGVDNTASVFFDVGFNSVVGQSWLRSVLDEKTWVFVAGQGEGTDRDTVTRFDGAAEPEGFNRREGFVDARDVEQGDTNLLESRGDEALAGAGEEDAFELDVATVGPFTYREDFDLGDTVTVRNTRWNLERTGRIVQAETVYTPTSTNVHVQVGRPWPTLKDRVNSSVSGGSGNVAVDYPVDFFSKSEANANFARITPRPLNPLNRGDSLLNGVADGGSHPLSERFDSLTEAQDKFPFVDSLTEQIDRAAIQSALEASRSVELPGGEHYIDRSIDGTLSTVNDEGLRISGNSKAAELLGETGARPIIDLTAQRAPTVEGIRTRPGETNPSQIGIAYTRNSNKQSAAAGIIRDSIIYVKSDPAANDGYGAVAFYGICAEVIKINGVDLAGDIGLVGRHDNFLGFQSEFVDTLADQDTSTMAIFITDQVRAFGWRFAMDLSGQMHYHNGLFLGQGIPAIGGGPLASDAVAIRSAVSSNLELRGSCEGHTKLLEVGGNCDSGSVKMKHHQVDGVPIISSNRVRAGLRGMTFQVTTVASSPTAPLIGSSDGATFDLSGCTFVLSEAQTVDVQNGVSGEDDRAWGNEFRSAVHKAEKPTVTLPSGVAKQKGNRMIVADGVFEWDGTTWIEQIALKGEHTETSLSMPQIAAGGSEYVTVSIPGIPAGSALSYGPSASLGAQFSFVAFSVADQVTILVHNHGSSAATPNTRHWKFAWA